MANLGNTIVNGILKVNGKVNVGESVTAPSFIGNLTGNADTATKAVRLMGIENRDIKPSVVPNDSVVGYFASKSGLEGSASQTDYVDVLTFNTWHNNSGGKLNALAFKKNGSQALYHYSADYGATTWGTPKQIAYTDSNITGNAATATKLATARNINGVAFDGTKDITINSSDNTKLPLAGGTMTGTISTALNGSWIEGFNGTKSIIKSTSAGASHTSLFSAASTNGRFQIFKYTNYMGVCYESNANISAGNNAADNGVYFNEAGTLYPSKNNVQTLGTSTMKWNNVYATNFTGLASNATSDASGNNIVNTYLRKDSVDSALSATSVNPVQNKIVKTALDGKAPTSHTHNYFNISTPTDGVNIGNVGSIAKFGIADTRACRTAFLPPSAVNVEYTTDGGATWLDYGATDLQKKCLTACGLGTAQQLKFGGKSCTTATNKIGLRITYSATDRYCQVDSAFMWVTIPRTYV